MVNNLNKNRGFKIQQLLYNSKIPLKRYRVHVKFVVEPLKSFPSKISQTVQIEFYLREGIRLNFICTFSLLAGSLTYMYIE